MQKSKLAKTIVAGLAACLVSASLLVGCGGNDAPNNEPPKAAARTGKIVTMGASQKKPPGDNLSPGGFFQRFSWEDLR